MWKVELNETKRHLDAKGIPHAKMPFFGDIRAVFGDAGLCACEALEDTKAPSRSSALTGAPRVAVCAHSLEGDGKTLRARGTPSPQPRLLQQPAIAG